MKNYLIALSLLTLAAASPAITTNMTFNGVAYGEVVNLTGHLNAGVWSAKLDFVSTPLYGNILTVCVDLDNFISGGQSWDANVIDSSLLSGNMKAAANIVGNEFLSADTADKACGLQLAVWEAVYDNGATLDLNSGNLNATGESASALSYAQAYYATKDTEAHAIYFQPVEEGSGQGQMTAFRTPLVPEPASIAGLSALAVAVLRRKRR